ncbi:SusC/RagA family TonB-linked outer membrane protein [Niastella populi]|uniref:Secretin/TonB short N-terminal domain-containing protein n=1 Tax=Niastella populi TaxID=550983 RepID=A0A1V9F849_9BACT|nr:SusC/RagA family TonB-linked outer membrane protein [Niastella populi]OQP54417.1 hypothetical protein A4R26_28065 [Niastella populi]
MTDFVSGKGSLLGVKPKLLLLERGLSKTLRIMKLTAIFLLAAALQVTAKGLAQEKITLALNNASLEKVFEQIEVQTGFVFIYKDETVKDKKVSIQVTNATLAQTLDACLKGQELSYKIVGKSVAIKAEKVTPAMPGGAAPPFIDVRGRVVNEKGEPVEGVTVLVKGIDKKTLTDKNGEFSLTTVEQDAVLVFTHIGMETFELKVSGKTELAISLKAKISELSGVVVSVNTGYQEIPKERATGSFSEPIKHMYTSRVSTDILSRLEGITSGLAFNTPGITGSSTPKLSIRGRSTIYANDNPLIVIDGFPYDGDINNINPNDIENINVLKDAAAASIWGVRAGNGVIVITTKKGKLNEALKVQLNSNISISEKPDLFYSPSFVSSNEFIGVENYLFEKGFYDGDLNDASSPPISPVVQILDQVRRGTLSQSEAGKQIDEFKTLDVRNDLSRYFYRRMVNQQYALSLSGGNNRLNHYVSIGIDRNRTTQKEEGFNRFTLNSMNTFVPVKNLEITGGFNYIQSSAGKDNTLSQISTGGGYNTVYPYASLAGEDGAPLSFVKDYSTAYVDWAESNGYLNGKFYPLEELRGGWNTSKTRNSDIRLSTRLKYTIIEGLSAEIRYQYQRALSRAKDLHTDQSYYTRYFINRYASANPDSSFAGYNIPYGSILANSTSELSSNNLRGQISYFNTWGKHFVTMIAGSEVREVKTESNSFTLYGYNDELGTSQPVNNTTVFPTNPVGSALIPYGNSTGGSLDRFRSYYFNGAYTFDDRYTLSLSGRVDGSNYFGVETNQKNVPLWSVGGKWNIDHERFYHSSVFPLLRLRATFGYNGNLDKNITAVSTIFYPGYTGPLTNAVFARLNNVGNPELRWEKIGIFNVGLDFGTAKNILSGSIEYFHKNGVDMIGYSPFAPSTGITNLQGNYAKIKGNGVDIQITSKNIDKQIKWTTTFIFSWAKDIVNKYTGTNIQPSGLVGAGQIVSPVEGKPVYGIYSFKWAGLDPATGDPQGFDSSKGVSKNYTDLLSPTSVNSLVFHGPARPVIFGGINNRISYKNFGLTFNISYKLGYYFNRNSVNYSMLFNSWSLHKDFTRRWQKAGDENSTNVPSMSYPANANRDRFYQYSEILVERGDHIRLQDVSLSYDFQGKLFNRMLSLSNIQVYFYANNLGILWRANDEKIDPDYPFNGFPAPRTFAFGIKAGF